MPSESASLSWPVITIWVVVNLVNLLQGTGFLSRIRTGDRDINHMLGHGILALAVPAAVALVAFIRARAGALNILGPVVFLIFIVVLIAVDYVWLIEFRDPQRPAVLVPYLLLFFGAIFLMGLPMYRISRPLWLVTVATTVFLLISMGVAMRRGVG